MDQVEERVSHLHDHPSRLWGYQTNFTEEEGEAWSGHMVFFSSQHFTAWPGAKVGAARVSSMYRINVTGVEQLPPP